MYSKTVHLLFRTLLRTTNEQVLSQKSYKNSNKRREATRNEYSSSSRLQLHLQQLLPQAHVSTTSIDINSHIRNSSPDDWTQRIAAFKKLNFNDDECYNLIINYPLVIDIPVHHIEKVINAWSLCKLESRLIHQIIVNQPVLLTIDAQEVQKRISFFQTFCRSNKCLTNFLINCPNVMADDWEATIEKMDYLLRVKRVQKSEIFLSQGLVKPLDFIKLRIELLEKCGIYEVQIIYPHKEYKLKKKAHTNPKLFKIIDTDDHTFSMQVAGITFEEYLIFSELFQHSDTESESSDDE